MVKATKASRIKRTSRTLILAALVSCIQARGAPINTGVEAIFWPAVIIAGPFLLVHDLLFGSDTSARESAEKEATRILKAHEDQIPTNGLYTGSVNLRWALYGMLVESRLPFIEVNTAGSAWLLSMAKMPAPLIAQAEQHKYIRLSLGKRDDPHCLTWANSSYDWTNKPPVRPGTCVLAVFDDDLQSNIQLNVDASRVSSRKLRWELVDRSTGKVLLSVPFWEPQTEGQPVHVSATYRYADEIDIFASVLRKLSPTLAPQGADGRPFVMNHMDEPRHEPFKGISTVAGEFRSLELDWSAIPEPRVNETWEEGYQRAVATGQPVIINHTLLVVPKEDMVRSACLAPGWCGSANFVSDVGVLSVRHEAAYLERESVRSPYHGSLTHQMYVDVQGRTLNGQLLWFVKIEPTALPQPFQRCMDFKLACYFYPKQATTTNQELVIRGVFGAQNYQGEPMPKDEYELVVPLSRLAPAANAH